MSAFGLRESVETAFPTGAGGLSSVGAATSPPSPLSPRRGWGNDLTCEFPPRYMNSTVHKARILD